MKEIDEQSYENFFNQPVWAAVKIMSENTKKHIPYETDDWERFYFIKTDFD